ncbi:MAG: ABC transporter permease, partial [Eggerthellaceae bacterium]|nr:ABC transporter permease [Eggerthellaceae bacterium]
MALEAILGNKMRSFLTMLGIIIGVIALVVLVSLVSSATTSITSQVSSLGSNMLTVTVVNDRGNPLSLQELETLGQDEEIAAVAPLNQVNLTARHGYSSEAAIVYGTTPAYYEIQNFELEYGRFLKTADVENSSYVVVLSYNAAKDLCGSIDVVGESVSLGGRSFLVVGVLAQDNSMMSMMSSSLAMYAPFTTIARLSPAGSRVTSFYVSATDTTSLDAAESALRTAMMSRFK